MGYNIKKKPKKTRKNDPFFEGYTRIDTGGIATFGTSVWKRDEGVGVIIVFPAGQMMKYAPQEEITQEEVEIGKLEIEKQKAQTEEAREVPIYYEN